MASGDDLVPRIRRLGFRASHDALSAFLTHAHKSRLGPTETVACRTANFHGLPGIEDVAAATLGFESGATASLVSVWHYVDERPSLRLVELFSEQLYVAIEGEWDGPVRYRFNGDAEETVGTLWKARDAPADDLLHAFGHTERREREAAGRHTGVTDV